MIRLRLAIFSRALVAPAAGLTAARSVATGLTAARVPAATIALAVVVAAATFTTAAIPGTARAFDDPDLRPPGFQNPISGFVGVTATVPGPAPDQPAVIRRPLAGTAFTQLPVAVTGICPPATFIIIMKNTSFAGATPCSDDGTFTVDVDLELGANRLVARVGDTLGQYGPDSAPVAVTYQPVGVPTAAQASAIGSPLYLQTDLTVTGGQPGTGLARRVNIVGGKGPYVVSWDWGDGQTSLTRADSAGVVARDHVYGRAGTYRVVVTATDASGNTALLQVVTVMNGVAPAVAQANPSSLPSVGSLGMWPMYGVMVSVVIAFWAGERMRIRREHRRARLALLEAA